MNGQKPREIAARVLGRRPDSNDYTETLLERALAAAKLSPADRGLTLELVAGVVRWQATLDWLIARKTPGRQQKAGLQDLLRLGLYQLFWLDRIPPHAAVHETVEQAKRSGYGAQAGFLNAVLRGYLREAAATRQLLQELKTTQPALGFSHPEWLVDRWEKQFGGTPTRQLLAWNNTPPKTFARLNTLNFGQAAAAPDERRTRRGVPERILTVEDFLAFWRDEGVTYDFVSRDWINAGLSFELKDHPPLSSLESFQKGWFYVQDPSTLLAVHTLAPQPGETILDLCAAPGGKTTCLAQWMNNTGHIIAHDNVPERLNLVTENCRRLGVTCVQTAPTLPARPATFDRILVDAPCSNTGVLRRRLDLRWRLQPAELERLTATQLSLLEKAAPLLKPGGTLVYSTCSLEAEENSELVKRFLSTHPEFTLTTERQLSPTTATVDGAYVAKMTRQKVAHD